MVSPIPVSMVRMQDGDEIRIGARTWRVVTGSGHSPEHACLRRRRRASLLIAGDQVLPRITSNVSLSLSEPEADPLGEWLASIAKLQAASRRSSRPALARRALLPASTRGSTRSPPAIAAASMRSTPTSPSRAARSTASSILFGRKIDDGSLGLATGEAMAHLRHLEVEGRAVREARDGVHWFRAAGLTRRLAGTNGPGHGRARKMSPSSRSKRR